MMSEPLTFLQRGKRIRELEDDNTRLLEKVEKLERSAMDRLIADAGVGTVPIGIERLKLIKNDNAQLLKERDEWRERAERELD